MGRSMSLQLERNTAYTMSSKEGVIFILTITFATVDRCLKLHEMNRNNFGKVITNKSGTLLTNGVVDNLRASLLVTTDGKLE